MKLKITPHGGLITWEFWAEKDTDLSVGYPHVSPDGKVRGVWCGISREDTVKLRDFLNAAIKEWEGE